MQPDGKTPRNRPYATFAKATKDLVAPAFATAPAKDASGPPDDTVRQLVWQRLPWLVWLMLLQSLTVAVMERYQGLVDDHMVIASFITMLVGGGSNISSQVVANIVSRVARASERKHGDVEGDEQTPRSGSPAGDIGSPWKALMTEVGASCVLGVALCFIVLPRVLWEDDTTKYDGIAITLSYGEPLISELAVAMAPFASMVRHRTSMSNRACKCAVGSCLPSSDLRTSFAAQQSSS